MLQPKLLLLITHTDRVESHPMKKLRLTLKSKFKAFNHYCNFKHEYSGRTVLLLALISLSGWLVAFYYYRAATVVPLISNDVLAQQTLAQTSIQANWQTVVMKHGDSLQKIFKELGLSSQDLVEIVAAAKDHRIFHKFKPGQKLKFLISSDQELQELDFSTDAKTNITITRNDTGFTIANNGQIIIPFDNTKTDKTEAKPTETSNPNIKYGFATVQRSLYDAGIQAGLSHTQTIQLVTLFSQNSNLSRNIRRGDQLSVMYPPGARYISFAQLTHHGKTYQIFRFSLNGNTDYYTADGSDLHPPIERAPLNYTRISSLFSAHRWNPILHFVRPHYGVDYAAPTGTPIKAAGDGRIIFAGVENGYGNVVKIKHLSPFETVYAHMSHFAKGIHEGVHVRQGETIGYVGDTGESTGSHLHFEIRENNIPRNPLTVVLPQGTPLPETERHKFLAAKRTMLEQFALYNTSKTKLAINSTGNKIHNIW